MPIGRSCAAALLLAAASFNSAEAWPQGYPARPVRYLVAGAAGSGSDTIARIVTMGLSPALGQQTVVDNRIAAIHEKTVAALNDGGVNKRLTDAGYIVAGNQPAEFKSHLKSEVDRFGALVRKLGLNAN